MTKYLISFPSAAMNLSAEDLQGVGGRGARSVEEAKAAGVWVFGGGIDETVLAGAGPADGTRDRGYVPADEPTGRRLHGAGGAVPRGALGWAAKLADACRCAQEVRAFHYDPAS